MIEPVFTDRRHAGRELAAKLSAYKGVPDALILALPRGGVPVAYEVAKALQLPLDIMLIRKLGVPGHEELAFGAIAEGGVEVFNEDVMRMHRIAPITLAAVAGREEAELQRRGKLYRGGRGLPSLEGRTVILVDDGIATGANMRAAVKLAQKQGAKKVVAAAPGASADIAARFKNIADEFVSVYTPELLDGVGMMYRDFSQTPDEEVIRLLGKAA